ncbi:MAG: hypothetical protein IPO66_08550 [Rhodanobacteraceae bacterium]|nr:hypothetical protein [Rhodanobacteraceae bacterium]
MLAIPAAIAGLLGSGRVRRRSTATLVSAAALICVLLLALTQVSPMLHGQVLRWSVDWFPALGLDFKLRLDALAWLFVLLISGIGTLVVVYANYYLGKDEDTPRFYAGLLAFAAAMLGVVTAGNLLLLVVFWEFTSLSSFLLISFWSDKPEARAGASMALTVTAGGGLALLAGVLLIGQVVGSLDLDVVLGAGDLLRADPRYPWILGLVLLGAFTKSAQFPFHFWLPQAMAAPTPVSALLHSATLVKAGVFLLARLYPALSGTPEWLYLVAGTGLLTLLIGSWKAIFQHDIKGLLAYSTISHLGLITLLLGLESPLTTVAAVFHMINHATFKASLFMAAGIIDHECGTRDMRRLHGLMKFLPWTGVLAVFAAAAMAGVPLLNGFLSKEMFFTESLAVTGLGMFNVVVPLGALLAGMFGVAYSTRFIHDVFFGQALTPLAHEPHEPLRWMRWPVEVLVLLCIAVGTFPAWTISGILDAAAAAAAGAPMPAYSLRLWHGFNLPLLMSGIAFVGGLALYFAIYRGGGLHRHQTRALASAIFQRAMAGLTTLAQRARRATELGLTMQLRVLLVSGLALALSASLLSPATWPTPEFRLDAPWPALADRSRHRRADDRRGRHASPAGARPGAAGRHRPSGQRQFRAAVRARSGLDPVAGGGGQRALAAAGPAPAAAAGTCGTRRAQAQSGRADRPERRRWRRPALPSGPDATGNQHLRLFSAAGVAAGRRHQCGQRHHRRLSRSRYAGRDDGFCDCRDCRGRIAAPLRAGAIGTRGSA